jgi:predicted transcriptional regulator
LSRKAAIGANGAAMQSSMSSSDSHVAGHHPKSVSELAVLAERAEQNVMRTLHKLSAVGLVRLDKGEGLAYQPVAAGRRVHFEIDLLA